MRKAAVPPPPSNRTTATATMSSSLPLPFLAGSPAAALRCRHCAILFRTAAAAVRRRTGALGYRRLVNWRLARPSETGPAGRFCPAGFARRTAEARRLLDRPGWHAHLLYPSVEKESACDTTSYLALSRQVTLERHMATIANNLANAATSGYRAEHTVFEQTLQPAGRRDRVAFVQDVGLARDTAPGPIEQTGNPLRHRLERCWLSCLRHRRRDALRACRSAGGRQPAGVWSTPAVRRCWTMAAIPITLPENEHADHHRRRWHCLRSHRPIGPDRDRGLCPRAGSAECWRRSADHRRDAGALPAVPGSSRARSRAPTSSQSWR